MSNKLFHISTRPIPKKITIYGDFQKGKMLIGWADSQLRILENQMINSGCSCGQRRINHPSGGNVICSYAERIRTIDIYYPVESVVNKEKTQKCWCNCNFSIGQITSVSYAETLYPVLEVLACYNEEHHVIYQDIIGSDWIPWEVGMIVIVLAYNDFLYDCYRDTFNSTGCKPIIDTENTRHTTNWRTTYRVTQLCAEGFPLWIDSSERVI